jgi:hypothetical protein
VAIIGSGSFRMILIESSSLRPWGSLSEGKLSDSCLLSDEQSLSPGARNARRQPGRGHEVALEHVYRPL